MGLGLRIDRWESDEEAVDIGHSASKDDVEILPKLSLTRHFKQRLYGLPHGVKRL